MFIFYARKNQLAIKRKEPVTSGSVNVYRARFEFSEDWDGLTQKAVFRGSGKTISVLLDNGACQIPWEALENHGGILLAGVYGTADETVLPTVWANLGMILEGAGPGSDAHPPTPDLWERELEKKGDNLGYDGLKLSLRSGDKELSSVQIVGGGEDDTADHRLLSGRDAENQHPISAIEGLREILDSIPQPMGADELRKILMKGDI